MYRVIIILPLLIISSYSISQKLIGTSQMLDFEFNDDSLRYSRLIDFNIGDCDYNVEFLNKSNTYSRAFCQDQKGNYYGLIYEQESLHIGKYYLYILDGFNYELNFKTKIFLDSFHIVNLDDIYYDEKSHSIYAFLLDVYKIDLNTMEVINLGDAPGRYLLDIAKINGIIYGLISEPSKGVYHGLELHQMRTDTVFRSQKLLLSLPLNPTAFGDIIPIKKDCDSVSIYIRNAQDLFKISSDFSTYEKVCEEVFLPRHFDTITESIELINSIFDLEEYKLREPCKDTIDLDFTDQTTEGYDVRNEIMCQRDSYRLSDEEIQVSGYRAMDSVIVRTEDEEISFTNTSTSIPQFSLTRTSPHEVIIHSIGNDDLDSYADVLSEITYSIDHDAVSTLPEAFTIQVIGYTSGIETDTAFAHILYDAKTIEAGEDMNLSFCMYEAEQDLTDFLSPSADMNGTWMPDIENGIFNPHADTSGIYQYIVENTQCNQSDTVLFTIEVYEDLSGFLGNDTTLCYGYSYDIVITEEGTVLWNDGSNEKQRKLSETGTYIAELSDNNGCIWSDTILVEVIDFHEINHTIQVCESSYDFHGIEITQDTIIEETRVGVSGDCDTIVETRIQFEQLDEIQLEHNLTICKENAYVSIELPSENYTIHWSGNQSGAYAEFDETGTYNVTVSSEHCDTTYTFEVTKCEEKPFYIPNAFSPNGDGINDIFTVYNLPSEAIKSLTIYDRWGAIIYENSETFWDGEIDEVPVGTGVYVYKFIFEIQGINKVVSGEITVLR